MTMDVLPEDPQAEWVAALSAGAVVGVPGRVMRIDTHLSHVFLSGASAFKLKRAVRLPFVDFLDPQARRAACAAELAANRPWAAAIYQSVRAVTQEADGSFALDGAGPAVDWVVAMRRFDQADQFDCLARAGRLAIAHVEGAARRVAQAHAAAPANPLAGHAADYRRVIADLRRTETHGAARLGLGAGAPLLFERLEFELARVGALVERRRRAGKVRRGHGDLHLRNICLIADAPTPFDALEFDPRLATTDVLYDLAFLLMDLRHVGLAAHANAAMNAYWDAADEDEEGLGLLAFFTALRAAVRMAVAVEAGDLAEAQAYRALGLGLLAPVRPVLLAIGGLSGVGKTAVGRAVAGRLSGPAGARLLRTDVLRKRKPPPAPDGAGLYGPAARAAVYQDLATHALAAQLAGASVVLDATFQETPARDAIAALSAAYWLEAPLAVRLARIARRVGDASDADIAVAAAQQAPPELPAHWRRINADRPVDAIAAEILDDLAGP